MSWLVIAMSIKDSYEYWKMSKIYLLSGFSEALKWCTYIRNSS